MNIKKIQKRHASLLEARRYFDSSKVSLVLLICISLTYSFVCMTRNCFSSAMVFIVDEGVLTKSQTGTITATFYIVYALLQLVGGALADKWHPERLIAIGYLGAGISNLIIYFNQSYLVMLAAWCFNAAAQFAVWPAIFKVVSTMLAPGYRKRGLFIVTFANPIGVVAGYIIAAFLTRWQLNFLISAVGLLSSAVIWLTVWAISKRKSEMKDFEYEAPTVPHASEHSHIKLTRALLQSGAIFLIAVSFIKTSFDVGVKSFTPTIISESYSSVSPSLATIISLVVIIAGGLGTYFSKVIYPKPCRSEASATAVMFIMAIIPAAVIIFTGKISYWVIVVAMALLVLFMSSTQLYVLSYLPTRFNRWGKGATVSGMVNFSSSLGVVMANLLFIRIADGFGWTVTMIFWLALIILGTVLSLVSIPKWRKFIAEEDEK